MLVQNIFEMKFVMYVALDTLQSTEDGLPYLMYLQNEKLHTTKVCIII